MDEYAKMVLSGLIGLGFDYKNLFYLDIEYNPAITKNFDGTGLSVTDRYMGITIGVNINTLIAK